ncbi:ectoine hydroxylase [Actinokineospora sp. UTMC 2448]|uniref:ectoine hydroxylase n=1 Tax=Actinokineospora sp. UTMC 2448 TaxID=2268449 RepID=UPI002164E834|nr:ectoine hydroxylase [Actinokineospora sp. UTMC 2448]
MRIPRSHPTVWGSTPGPIAEADLAAYDRDGYLVLKDLLSDEEVNRYREELRRLNTDEDVRSDDRVVLEPDSEDIRSVFEAHLISPVFGELLRSRRLVSIARQVLGSDVYIHQSRVNFKPAFGGAEFDWHSDFETWHAEDGMPVPRAFSMSIALTENHPHNGPLMVIPGSHNTFVSCVGETPPNYHETSLRVHRLPIGSADRESLTDLANTHGIRQITGRAGSAVMFDCNILHGSNGNITPHPRSNIFVVFNSIENTLKEPYAALNRRPSHLASHDFSPIR